jgi:hypothetical protein
LRSSQHRREHLSPKEYPNKNIQAGPLCRWLLHNGPVFRWDQTKRATPIPNLSLQPQGKFEPHGKPLIKAGCRWINSTAAAASWEGLGMDFVGL